MQKSTLRAVQFLLKNLSDPERSTTIIRNAEKAGIPRTALYRAAKILKIRKSRRGFSADKVSVWSLPLSLRRVVEDDHRQLIDFYRDIAQVCDEHLSLARTPHSAHMIGLVQNFAMKHRVKKLV